MIEILGTKTLHGPNVFHSKPVLIMRLALGDYKEVASCNIPGFLERISALLPGIREHGCSVGKPGGFIERLLRGTYPAHIIEHVAIEMSALAGIGVHYGKTVFESEPAIYKVVTRFQSEEGMKYLLCRAVDCFLALAKGNSFDLEGVINEAKKIISENSLGPSGQALEEAALKRGIPVRRIGPNSLLELGYGIKRRRVQAAVSDRTGLIATELVQDKSLTKELLKKSFVPVPLGGCARSEEELRILLKEIPTPWAIKPIDGHHGQGVVLDVENQDDALRAFHQAREFSSRVLVEQMMRGRDYRLLVVNGRMIAASERDPANVTGDGIQTIQKLIDSENRDPRRGDGHMSSLTNLPVDSTTLEVLMKQNFDLSSVPENGKRVLLRKTANLSTGGAATDVTSSVHPEIRELSERIAGIVDLDICGIDLIHSDIRRCMNENTAVIEVNAGPGLRMHLSPTVGEAQDVGRAIIESLFPNGDTGRIPIIAVTGTNGKTTVTRLLAHILSTTGRIVGHTTSNGIYINGNQIANGDTTGPLSAATVLSDPRVEAAVLETARGGIMRGGLAYDLADVGIVTNIRPDHIGQDGIESIEDIVRVKGLIAEQVRDGGTVVLNADDPESAKLAERTAVRTGRKKICFYSISENNDLVEENRDEGHCSYFARGGWLIESKGDTEIRIVHVRDLRFTFNGTSEYQISNALAVCAGARALKVSIEVLRAGLMTFESATQNLGRGTLYKVGSGHLFLDYGHNPDAILAVAQTIRRWRPRRLVGILGLPGDRADDLLLESAKVAALHFDRLILRDDYNRRGRAEGEVPLMALKAAGNSNRRCEAAIILDEKRAIMHVIEELRPGDVAVVFYDELERALEVLRGYDPQPVTVLPDFSELGLEERIGRNANSSLTLA